MSNPEFFNIPDNGTEGARVTAWFKAQCLECGSTGEWAKKPADRFETGDAGNLRWDAFHNDETGHTHMAYWEVSRLVGEICPPFRRPSRRKLSDRKA